MSCPDCAVLRHELLMARAALTAMGRTIDRLQRANEAHDARAYGFQEGRAYPDLGGITSRTGQIPSTAHERAATERERTTA